MRQPIHNGRLDDQKMAARVDKAAQTATIS